MRTSLVSSTPYGSTSRTPPAALSLATATTGYSANVYAPGTPATFPVTSTGLVVRGNISTSAWGTERTNQGGGGWEHWMTAAVFLAVGLGVLAIGLCVDRRNRRG